jgi:hypothetical protein
MTAFARALAALHGDPNMRVAAEYRRARGAWLPVGVILSQPTDDAGTAIADRLQADIAEADIGGPLLRGDELRIGSKTYAVETPMRDAEGLSWRADLSEMDAAAAPAVAVGAIRYDAWDAPASPLTIAEAAALSQTAYLARAPFWATVAGSTVTLPAATQARIDAEIDQAVAAGLDFWAFLGWAPGDTANAALNLYRSSAKRGQVGFCIIENMQGLFFLGSWLPNVARTIGLMAETGYRRVLGTRPLLFINAMSDADIIARFGSLAATATVFAGIRSQCIAAGVGDPYIVVMDGWHVRAASLAAYGADAATSYAALGQATTPTPYASLSAAVEQWRIDLAALGVDLVVPLTAGWDPRPRIGGSATWFGAQATGSATAYWQQPTPAELAQHVADGIAWLRRNPTAAPAQVALLYAWNEFTEGGWICPTWISGNPAGDTSRIATLAGVLAP